jgi:hypothetical protein
MNPLVTVTQLLAQRPLTSAAYNICLEIANKRGGGDISRLSIGRASFVAWQESTNFTYEESNWYTHVQPVNIRFRRALGVLPLPPAGDVLFAIISPFPIITEGLAAALPRLSTRITGETITCQLLRARLGHFLKTALAPVRDILVKYELLNDNGMSITYWKGNRALLDIPDQFLYLTDEANARDAETIKTHPGITSISLRMDDGSLATVSRDLSVEIFSASSPWEEVASRLVYIASLIGPSSEILSR